MHCNQTTRPNSKTTYKISIFDLKSEYDPKFLTEPDNTKHVTAIAACRSVLPTMDLPIAQTKKHSYRMTGVMSVVKYPEKLEQSGMTLEVAAVTYYC